MSDLRELYQQMIVDHSKRPRNARAIDCPTHQGEGVNPLCGDKVKIYLEVDQDQVKDASFEGSGCAISTASASMLTEAAKGKNLEEVETLFQHFQTLVTADPQDRPDPTTLDLGKLAVFEGVCEYPARVKCATLAWHTLRNALSGDSAVAVTE